MKVKYLLLAFLLVVFLINFVTADGLFYGKINSKGTILEPNQQAIILHDDEDETILLRVSASGDLGEFGWVIPLPSYPEVSALDSLIFDEIDSLTPPHHYWYNPKSRGTDSLDYSQKEQHVIVETQIIGNFKISRIKSDDTDALFNWLTKHKFALHENSKPMLDDYIKRKFCFIAIRIVPDKLKNAKNEDNQKEGWLDSLRIDFKSRDVFFPMKISSFNPGGTHLTLWLITDHRMKCIEGQTVWANWIDPEMLKDLKHDLLSSKIDKQRFLTRIECEWLDNNLIADDIYLQDESIDLPFPKKYWDSTKKKFVHYEYGLSSTREFDVITYYEMIRRKRGLL